MFLISELRRKDVINELDGKKLGYVYDIEIDINTGSISSLVLPGENRFFGLFTRSEEMIIPWDKIKKIGLDVILIGEECAKPMNAEIMPSRQLTPVSDKTAAWEDWEL